MLARIEAELPRGQKMQYVHPQVALLGLVLAIEQSCKLNPTCGHLKQELLQETLVHTPLAIAVQEADVFQERTLKEFLLCDQMEGPFLLGRKGPANRQLALDDRPSNAAGRFDLDELFSAVDHLHQEIRHDVTRTGALFTLERRGGRAVEKLNLGRPFPASPGVPDGQGLLLNMGHPRASDQNDGRRRFKLALATDRATLPRARYQQERTRRTSPEAKRRKAARGIGVGHGSPFV